MNNTITLFFAIAISFTLNFLITPALIKLSHKYGWYDITNARKIHSGNIPRIGGVGLFISFTISVFIFLIINKLGPADLNTISKYRYIALAAGFLIITALGVADDFFEVRVWYKLIIQIIAALTISLGGFCFEYIYIPFFSITIPLGVFSHILTVFWIVSFCNALNLLDGMDGLAGSVAFIASLFFGIIFLWTKDYTAAVLSFTLLGSIAGFLFFNLPPAKIFMGDSGSLFLGFSLAVFPLINSGEPVGTSKILFMPLIILIIPTLDMIAAIIRRRRRGFPIFSADREHIHHKLLDFGFSQKKILLVISLFSVFAGLGGILYTYIEKVKLDYSFFVFLFVWALYVAFFSILHYKNQSRKKAILKK